MFRLCHIRWCAGILLGTVFSCEFVGWISTPGPASVNTGQEQCLKEEGMKELSGDALEVFKKSLPVVPGMSGGAWLCISDAAVG